MFKRPDSDDEDGYYPRSGSSFQSSSRGSRKEELARTLGSFAKNKFVSGSAESQADFYGKQQINQLDEQIAGGGGHISSDERNKINAKILKAEMKGDVDLVAKLKRKLDGGGHTRESNEDRAGPSRDKTVVMMKRDRSGYVIPASRKNREDSRSTEKGHSGMRTELSREQSLAEMLREERSGTAEDQLRLFERALVSSAKVKRTDEESVDDIAELQKRKKKHEEKDRKKEEKRMRKQHDFLERALDDCSLCIQSRRLQKQCIVAVGITTYLTVTSWEGLDDEHLLIIPQAHGTSSIQLDEDVYEEMRLWRKGLVAMWRSAGKDCVFMEMARDVGANCHMAVECIPLGLELGDTAPIYFKKAINECEGEYTDNKKLIEIRDLRKQIPRGFSYFAIDFGLQNGFAHVIENKEAFPSHFGTEILAGMMDLPPNRWRKRTEQSFEEQKKKAAKMKEEWTEFDWTKRIRRDSPGSGED